MTKFYVSSTTGSDNNLGKSEDSAWASLAKVKAGFADGSIRHGDSILLKCGDIFYENLVGAFPSSTNNPGHKLILSNYGVGSKPILSGYRDFSNASWVQHDANTWKVDLTNPVNFTGFTSASTNVGIIRYDGVIRADKKKFALGDLSSNYDFYTDATSLYVRLPADPTSLHDEILVAHGTTAIQLSGAMHNIVVSGLEIMGFGAHGIRNASCKNVEVVGCSIHEIGGATLSGTTRYGNGVEGWIGTENFYVHHNDIYDIFETATTLQGPEDASNKAFINCHFKFNRIWNSAQSFEIWATRLTTGSADIGYVNCSFEDNECYRAGQGWSIGHSNTDGNRAHVLMYSVELPADVSVKRNLFAYAEDCYIFRNTNGGVFPAGLVCEDNTILLEPGKKVQWQTSQTIENFASWSTATGRDGTSIGLPSKLGSITTAKDVLESLIVKELQSVGVSRKSTKSQSEGLGRLAKVEMDIENSPNISTVGPITPMEPSIGYAGHGVTTISSVATANGFMTGWRLVPGRNCLVNKLGIQLQTVGSAGSVIRLGIYEFDMRTRSGKLVVDAGTFDASVTTGYREITIPDTAIYSGRQYVVVSVSQGSPTTTPTIRVNDGSDDGIGASGGVVANTRLAGLQVNSVLGSLPDTVTFSGSGSVARVVVIAK